MFKLSTSTGIPFSYLAVAGRLWSQKAIKTLVLLAFLGSGWAAVPAMADDEDVAKFYAEDEKYPDKDYMVGIGAGGSFEIAQDAALSDLSTRFRVKVQSLLESDSSVQSNIDSQGESVTSKEGLSQNVRLRTQASLDGSEIARRFKDPDTGRFYVKVVLNRKRAASQTRESMRELDKQINSLQTNQAKQKPLEKLFNLNEIQRHLTAYQVLRIDYQTLTGKRAPNPYGDFPIQSLRQKAKEAALFEVKITAPSRALRKDVASAVGYALSREGLRLVKRGKGRYQLKVELTLERPYHKRGRAWQEGAILISLVPEEHTAGLKRQSFRVASTHSSGLQARMRARIRQALAKSFHELVFPKHFSP